MKLDPDWEYVADTVMGGVSTGRLEPVSEDGKDAMRLTGEVSLDNNGGFVQMALDLPGGAFDASSYEGVWIELRGNWERYDLRLRTIALTRPWQSYRAELTAPGDWITLKLPFNEFTPHRTETTFDPSQLRRIGLLAIGREFTADVTVAGIGFY